MDSYMFIVKLRRHCALNEGHVLQEGGDLVTLYLVHNRFVINHQHAISMMTIQRIAQYCLSCTTSTHSNSVHLF